MNLLTPSVIVTLAIGGLFGFDPSLQNQASQTSQRKQSGGSRVSTSILGFVVTTSGEGVPDVHLSLNAISNQTNLFWFVRGSETTTRADGAFEFENVARGVYIVAALDFSIRSGTCRPGDSVTMRLSNSKGRGVITGRVTDENGKPAIEAPVRALGLRDSEGPVWIPGSRPLEGLTDDRGTPIEYGASRPARTFYQPEPGLLTTRVTLGRTTRSHPRISRLTMQAQPRK